MDLRGEVMGLCLGLLVFLGCHGAISNEGVAAPASIEVVPAALAVAANTPFELTVIVRDAAGNVVPETGGPAVAWRTSDPWLEVQGTAGHTAVLYAHGWFSGGTTGTFTVTAETEGVPSGTAVVTVERDPAGSDRIVAVAVPGALNAAIVDAVTAAGPPVEDQLVAFPSEALLGDLTGGGPVGFFSTATGMGFEEKPWTVGADVVDFTALGGPLPVAVAIWVAASSEPDVVRALAIAEADLATVLFRDGRSGLAFANPDGAQLVPGDAEVGSACADAATWGLAEPPPANAFTPGAVNVYYVDEVTETSTGRAVWCRGTATRPEPVVYVPAVAGRTDATLTHELGHTLDLRHVYLEGGAQTSNIMDGNWSGKNPDPRHQVSLGQAFRANLDPDSWVNLLQLRGPAAPKVACPCSAAPASGACPVLYLDPRPAMAQFIELCPT